MITFLLFLVCLGLAFQLGREMMMDEARKTMREAIAKYEEVSAILENERIRRDEIAVEIDDLRRLISSKVLQ